MRNLDLIQQERSEILARMSKAITENDASAYSQAFNELANSIQEVIRGEYDQAIQSNDSSVLAQRGCRQLTSEENKYYNAVIEAMKQKNPQQAMTNLDVAMPRSVIDDVFDDLISSHPLLDAIDFQNAGAVIEWLLNVNPDQLATWSPLTAGIIKELTSGFKKIDLQQNKLSAFIPVAKAMLDLGPVWMDRYVRAILSEALYFGLEDGILSGRGQTQNIHEPIGMRKDMSKPVDQNNGYQDRDKVVLVSLDPVSYGSILVKLAETENGHTRVIKNVIMVVNPKDYLTKIMPATTPRSTDGTYKYDVFPFPTTVIQSSRMAEGEAVLGIAERYFMAAGTGKSGKIEYDDSYHFLEDERVYITKFYGHGQPKDNKSFVLLDISGLQPYVQQVYVANESISVLGRFDARLSSLSIGSLTLSPGFNKSVFIYEATTTNATNTISASAVDGEAIIEILNGSTPVINGAAATWSNGENIVTINVTSGTETETYVVTVTKS
jgi:hypothetical protein